MIRLCQHANAMRAAKNNNADDNSIDQIANTPSLLPAPRGSVLVVA
jgi:hypothetical protein